MTPMSHPPYSPSLTLDGKVPRGKRFAHMKEVKQKTAEALNDIKTDEFKNCFEQWKKNISINASHQMESTLKVAKV